MRSHAAPLTGRLRRPHRLPLALSGAALIALGTGLVHSQQPSPAADRDAMYLHIKKAEALAGGDLTRFFYRRCLVEPAYPRTIAQSNQAAAAMEPAKVMDRLYFLGQNAVSSWALETSEGFVIFDTLNSPDEARTYIEGGLTKLGLDPGRIKYIVLTHEHGDHYAGATYLKGRFGARIMASKIAWDLMAAGRTAPPPPAPVPGQAQALPGGAAPARTGPAADWAKLVPARDIDIIDGQVFTAGDTKLAFYVTPGHAKGVLSAIFTATDGGVPHVIGFHGGLGSIREPDMRETHVDALKRWRSLAQKAGVDTLIANHQTQDGAVENLELVKIRRAGDPNPFVLGREGYLRYLDINIECTYANMARNGQTSR